MILVTGAGGKTGKAIIQALAKKGGATRAFIYSPQNEEPILAAGASEVVIGNMLDPADFRKVASGVDAIYHICPNVHPKEVEIGVNAIQAAQSNDVGHFIYHSVLHPQIEAMPHHWLKLRVEELIFESGLPFTILQPTAYMQNILGQTESISVNGEFVVPYSVETRISLVDLGDVAEAASMVIGNQDHFGATYELCGPGFFSQIEIAGMLEENLGRQVKAKQIKLDEWKSNAKNSGMGKYQIETLIKMFEYYDKYDFRGNPFVLEGLLGRPHRNFRSVLTSLQ